MKCPIPIFPFTRGRGFWESAYQHPVVLFVLRNSTAVTDNRKTSARREGYLAEFHRRVKRRIKANPDKFPAWKSTSRSILTARAFIAAMFNSPAIVNCI